MTSASSLRLSKPLDPERLLKELSLAFQSIPDNNIIPIPENAGNGIVRRISVTEGLEAFFWDMELTHPKDLKKIVLNPSSSKTFTVLCTLSPDVFRFRVNGHSQDLPNILFTSLEDEIDFSLLAGGRIKAVMIHFSGEWLKEECREADPDQLFLMHDLLSQQAPLLFMEEAPFSLHQMLVDIHAYAAANLSDSLRIKAKTISVLHDMLSHLMAFYSQSRKEGNRALTSKMSDVEKIMNEHLESNLPSISVIAKQLALSESTLKRNFKQAYGMGLYEYYLQKKMQLARKLFDEKPITVNEVAHMLGYEKTSNFIKIFRKFYGHSPGLLKKKFSSGS